MSGPLTEATVKDKIYDTVDNVLAIHRLCSPACDCADVLAEEVRRLVKLIARAR